MRNATLSKFQSTHPHGVRPMTIKRRWRKLSFNPRTHTGCDKARQRHSSTAECFNPRTHTGCDVVRGHGGRNFNEFQSTHPHGVRRYLSAQRKHLLLFQSTHPHGVRPPYNRVRRVPLHVSIHAPTRGATYHVVQLGQLHFVSIHAPTRGATTLMLRSTKQRRFQSTHPHGVRPSRECLIGHRLQFQSTHPHGVRQRLTLPMRS